MAQRFEYKVDTIRTSLVGDKIDGGDLEDKLNDRAKDGWQLKTVAEAMVEGRVGPGGTEGLLAIFERPVG